MLSYNFADQYRAAGLSPGPEVIRLRQEPFDKLRKNISTQTVLDLTRLYFGIPVPGGTDWFRDAFRETDPSFSMHENEHEVSVLSVCLLAAALADGLAYAGLAPIVAAAGGHRTPLVYPAFIEESRQELAAQSVKSRQHTSVDPKKISQPVKSKIGASADALVAAPDWPKSGELFKLVSSESMEASKTLANQVVSVVSPLAKQVCDLQEEVAMLWWYIGGWSRALERPFADLGTGLTALMAGLDLAHLTQRGAGPIAAPAILQRVVVGSGAGWNTKLALTSAVEALPAGAFQLLEISKNIGDVSDLCPVLSALAKAEEIGGGAKWHAAFKRDSRLDATSEFLPIELAMQVYRESLLLAQVG